MKVKCFNIKWETDGEVVDLPKTMTFDVCDKSTDDEIEEFLTDALSDRTGWLHDGYSWSRVGKKQQKKRIKTS